MTGVLDRVRRALRGPHLAILAVLTMFLLNCLSYRGFSLRWPIETWQMYSGKAPTRQLIPYRRFLIHTRDGHSEPTSLDQIPFLARAYRIDAGLSRDLPGLMEVVLRELSRQDPNIVGFTYETRAWAYRKRTLDEHLAIEPPTSSYSAWSIADRPAVPRDPGNLLVNGDFEAFEPASGVPRSWTASGSSRSFGFGLDARGDHAFRFGGQADTPQMIHQIVQLAPGTAHGTVRVRARVLAPSNGAALEVILGTPDHPAASASSPASAAPSTWQDLTATLEVPGDASNVTVVLHGAADTLFDDVALTVEP